MVAYFFTIIACIYFYIFSFFFLAYFFLGRTGFVYIVDTMRKNKNIDAVYDWTIGKPYKENYCVYF